MPSIRSSLRLLIAISVLFGLVGSSCGGRADSQQSSAGDVTVFAAASLTAAFTELGEAFMTKHPDAHVTFNFAASSELVTQIDEGAPADVYASADLSNMTKLTDAGNNASDPVVFATNRLAIMVAPGNPLGITGLADLANPDLIVVLCDPEVPCGKYAAQVLENAAVTVTPKSLEENVNAVVSKVTLGEADAGIVYETDIAAAGDEADGVELPVESNVVAQYPIVVTKDAANPELARAFIEFVNSEQGQRVLASYGFLAPTSTAPTTTVKSQPAGPTANVSTEIVGGGGVFIAESLTVDLTAAGYVEHEYLAEGTATSYVAAGTMTGDGRWSFAADNDAPYRTRVLVRMPGNIADFSGTVVIEWLNVSGGVDADPEWIALHEEIMRRGDAWVGVSAQLIGVIGGPVVVPVDVPGAEVAGEGLVTIDPVRYGSLQHPGDGFSYDIFTQVARAVRSGAGMLGGQPQQLIAAGQSQSAYALVTYYNGVQPLTEAFDGFFVHSRGASWLPLVGPGLPAGIVDAIAGTPTTLRTDQSTPALDLQSETDVTGIFNSALARQPDDAHFRLWEVAGTAHFDEFLLGASSKAIDCDGRINDGPMHVVAKAALRALTAWIATGSPPDSAPRLQVTSDAAPQIQRDNDGIALGGIRTPPVDVPVATLSGAPTSSTSVICLLLGSTTPFTRERLAALYASPEDYFQRFDAMIDSAIVAGYVLAEDRAAMLEFAHADLVG